MAKDSWPISGGNLDPVSLAKLSVRLARRWKAKRTYDEALTRYDHETAEAAEKAVLAGRKPDAVFARADKLREEREERRRLLADPPPHHGTARWATSTDLGTSLRGRSSFDDPRSILLGSLVEGGRLAGLVHWDGDGHLMTLAPTRTGKAVTTIIPNLLRYRGSCVVLDPKGELYASTSKWRATLGPVYRFAPFDDGADPARAGWRRDGFNPLADVRTEFQARSLATTMLPRDPKSPAFFQKDAVAFLSALMLHLRDLPGSEPRDRTMRSVVNIMGDRGALERLWLPDMAASPNLSVRAAAENVLGKAKGSGTSLVNFFDTLHSELHLWREPGLLRAMDRPDIDFARLKDAPATVYVEVPFRLMRAYGMVLQIVLRAALDAMTSNATVPPIPVLFVLDEFLALDAFPDMADAIRTHAGAGVRLWFFLQDIGKLQELYPGTSWQAFFNSAAKQIFGTNEAFTAELVSRHLANRTVAYLTTGASTNLSAQMGGHLPASATFNISSSENLHFIGRALLTPDEVTAELSAWNPGGTRSAILWLSNVPRPVLAQLTAYTNSAVCREREGALLV